MEDERQGLSQNFSQNFSLLVAAASGSECCRNDSKESGNSVNNSNSAVEEAGSQIESRVAVAAVARPSKLEGRSHNDEHSPKQALLDPKGQTSGSAGVRAEDGHQKLTSTEKNPPPVDRNPENQVKLPPVKEEDTSNHAMMMTVKSLSKDPLVQLSMLRAMKQKNFPADRVENIKREREKALALKQRASMAKKRKKSAPDSSRNQTKESARADSSGQNNRLATRGSTTSPPLGASSPSQSFQGNAEKRPPEVQAGPIPGSAQEKVAPPTSQGLGSQAGTGQLLALLQSMQNSQPQPTIANCIPRAPGPAEAAPALSSAVLQLAIGNPGVMQLLTGMMSSQGGNQNGDGNQSGHGAAAASMPSVSAQNSNTLGVTGARSGGANDGTVDAASPRGEGADAPEAGFELKIPCRARGLPSDHNFQNAHFIIPQDIKHGQDLICSYPACRVNGIKFRYCLFCRLPVARRNFRLRHYHKDEVPQPPPRGSKNVQDSICRPVDQVSAQNDNEIPNVAERPPPQLPVYDLNMISSGCSSDKRKRPGSSRDEQIPLTIQTSNDNEASGEVIQTSFNPGDSPKRRSRHGDKRNISREKKRREHSRKKPRKHSKRKRDCDRGDEERRSKRPNLVTSVTDEPFAAAAIAKSTKHSKRKSGTKRNHETSRKKKESMSGRKVSSKRQQIWSDLLRKRPCSSEGEGMSKWLMKVMAVSDLRTPLKVDGEDSSSPSSLTLDELGSDDLSP